METEQVMSQLHFKAASEKKKSEINMNTFIGTFVVAGVPFS